MTEVTELLGSTGVVPAGDYSPEKTYDFLNMVYAAPSVYVSRKNNNTGHPVTDTDWWMLSIDGSKNPEAVKAALDAAAKALEAAAAAAPVVVNVEGADVTINVEGNHKYICGGADLAQDRDRGKIGPDFGDLLHIGKRCHGTHLVG